jgi:hypothetical protein
VVIENAEYGWRSSLRHAGVIDIKVPKAANMSHFMATRLVVLLLGVNPTIIYSHGLLCAGNTRELSRTSSLTEERLIWVISTKPVELCLLVTGNRGGGDIASAMNLRHRV